MAISRRQFVARAAITAGFTGLGRYLAAQGFGRGGGPPQPYLNEVEGYGPLVDDPKGFMDLPRGFTYTVISHTGQMMDDGLLLPGLPDGMAAFPGPNGRVIVVRNHELTPGDPTVGPFGYLYELLPSISAASVYDMRGGRPHLGGTTTFVYNPATGRIERQFLSLVGTLRNCAGGPTPWNTWISCEESIDRVDVDGAEKDHGYNFEVPASADSGLVPAVPLKAMGRFYHEAVAVHPPTGIVYQTEDRGNGLLYRFIPQVPGQLGAGGRLQVLAVRDQMTLDTRNWADTGKPRLPVRERLAVRWMDIDEVESPNDDLRRRGAEMGATIFARGEGMWYGQDEVYFACTNGGLSQRGQIFRYVPSPAEGTAGEEASPAYLELYLEPDNALLLESCDNVAIAPWGDLIICEDNAAPPPVAGPQAPANYLRGVTPDGKLYTLGRNRYPGTSELAGACFAPNTDTMFVNIYEPGLTLAITGPW